MEYNIIEKYIKFIKREFSSFFKIVLSDDYSKKLCDMFIDRYIDVRYYDETDYPNEKEFINKINKELLNLYEALHSEDDNQMKNIISLFGYLIYFDDVEVVERELEIITALVEDGSIKVKFDNGVKSDLTIWFKEFKKKKESFNDTVLSKEFYLNENKVGDNVYLTDLEHNIKISNLYSEYAINKVYDSGTVFEQRLFITYILTCYNVLENARNLNFNKHYIVGFSDSLFEKNKKSQRLINVLDNTLAKKMISIKINYSDYLKNKQIINNAIAEGYSFGVVIDSFDKNVSGLIKFSYVFVDEKSEFYDMILSEKDKLKTMIIVM